MPPKTAPVTMYDAVTPGNIPTSAQVVAGYIDGAYAWKSEDWARFPDAEKVLITVNGDLRGNVADVENGDMTPASALRWIQAKQGKGIGGCTIYCSRDNLSSVLSACHGHAYYIWVADWTDSAHPVSGTVATQYSNVDNAYDLSEVYSQQWLDTLFRVNRPWPL
jgi:hypothetical protein